MAIIISQSGKNAQKVEQSKFEQEDHLQQYIYDNPESIPLYEINEDIRLLIMAREFPTQSGPIDALGVDAEGTVYMIETKLYKNPDKRLVVAQVLDYGASLWKNGNDFTQFTGTLNKASEKNFKMPVNEKLKEYFGFEDEDLEAFWTNVKANLNEGSFKFVVLMDKLHKRLKDLIVFLNQNSQFDVYAVELEYYKHETFEIIIPKIFGAEVKKDIAVSTSTASARKSWTIEAFWEDATRRLKPEELVCIKKIYDFAKTTADDITLGTGNSTGSFNPKYDAISKRSFYTVFSDGRVAINIGYLENQEQAEKYYEILNKHLDLKCLKNIDKGHLLKFYPRMQGKEVVVNYDKFIEAIKDFIKKQTS